MAEDDEKNVNKPLLEDNVNEQPLIDKKSLKKCDSVTEFNAVNNAVTDENDEKAVVLGSVVTEVVMSFVESKVEAEAENVTAGAESVVLSKTEGNDEAVAEENVSVDESKIELKKDELLKLMKHKVGSCERSCTTGNEESGGAVTEGDVSIAEVAKDGTMEQIFRKETEPSVLDDSQVLHEAMGAEVENETDADTELKHELDNSQSVGANTVARVATRNEENGEAVRQGVFSTAEATIEVTLDGADLKKREEVQCRFEGVDVEGETSTIDNDADKLILNKVEENDEMVVETDVSTIEAKAVEMDVTKHEEVEHVSTLDDSQGALVGEEDEAIGVEEETTNVDTEVETETDTVESGESLGGKRKRRDSKSPGNSKAAARASSRKITEEDVCFVCFDGGDLVLCDHRGCPKAYHPCCVNRDEAFFRAKGRWNCGWHQCSNCEKKAYYMCYTCPFSLCKGCIKNAVILCVRGNKGFCETCMRTVKLIESNGLGDKDAPVDFDDKSCWEYLFKDYFVDLKMRLSLSSEEIANAKSPWKGSDESANKHELADPQYDNNDDGASGSDDSIETLEASKTKRRSLKRRSKSLRIEEDSTSAAAVSGSEGFSTAGTTEWASKELLEFVKHMKNGDASVISQFDVQALVLEYIKTKKLRDPHRKSQIICDSRLERLFGKPRVGHFEMLKLLESHFLLKEDSQIDDVRGSIVDTEVNHFETDRNADTLTSGVKDRKRKRKKGERRGPQSNRGDCAAINVHNISLIYLRRKLIEDLLEEIDNFHEKVFGTFVRIRISGSAQKQDLYRLVQVVGTSKAAEPYKLGKRTTDIVLDILNLNKTEVVSIDTVSNQDFTEEECKRLRQSIRCGLINRLTVGDVLDKAVEIQPARVDDWLESEILRLSHLRDRASEKGRKKELRECVEKLQLLKTPDERHRRLDEVPEIHADPKMDPSYESEDDDGEKESRRGSRDSSFSRRGNGPVSPGSNFSPKDSRGSAGKFQSKNWEFDRSLSSKNIFSKSQDAARIGEIVNENAWKGKDWETESQNLEKLVSATNSETIGWNSDVVSRSSGVASVPSPATLPVKAAETVVKINETEKMWHYKDPSGKAQGPFSMVQLRKWSNTGYFPADLKIWRITEKEGESILLTDALEGRFEKASPAVDSIHSRAIVQNRDGERPHLNHSRGSENSPSLSVSARGGISSFVEVRESENNVSSVTGFGPVLNSGEGIPAGPTNPMQHTQSIASNEQHAAVMNNQPGSQNATVQSIQSLNIQNPNVGAHTFAAASLNGETNGSVAAPGHPQGYGNWVTSSVQNSAVSFSSAGASVVPQPHYWGAQTQGGQPNVQPPSMPTAPWGVVQPESISSASALRPENPNTGWGMMPGNANMTWSGQVPAAMNMNWGVTVQAMPVGNANPGMVVPTVPVLGNLNQGWVAPLGNPMVQGFAPGNANQGWVATTVNMGSTVPGLTPSNGWVTGIGNPGTLVQGQSQPPGDANANQGWRPSTGSPGTRNNEHRHHGGNFSRHKDEGSHGGNSGYNGGRWNRQSSFGSRGPGGFFRRNKPCPYNTNGRCVKGSECNYLHS
ncbi:zinc finger CCCH domain-containing protein 19-like isoform X2 [Nicotiana tabacum]|uniref:Zinc finger CCCH domain-containing protein 19-like isoform X2 n=1 Tax=Nicotiana tabacum TaxID=4097 RepID=A0AC58TEV5_TOBAC